MKIRLNRFLAQCGIASRRGADELIFEGRVKVNARVVTELGTTIDPTKDEVRVGRKRISQQPMGVRLFHKPKNVVSTMSDPEKRPCIADYMQAEDKGYYPVGRLDFESTGLVVLTNDGDLAARLMHPRYGSERVYEIKVAGVVNEKTIRRLQKGVNLSDGYIRSVVEVLETAADYSWLKIIITSGRNRIIRRLMDHVHHPVIKLHRTSHGPFTIGKLKRGEIQELSEKKYQHFRAVVMGEKQVGVNKAAPANKKRPPLKSKPRQFKPRQR